MRFLPCLTQKLVAKRLLSEGFLHSSSEIVEANLVGCLPEIPQPKLEATAVSNRSSRLGNAQYFDGANAVEKACIRRQPQVMLLETAGLTICHSMLS